MVVGQVARDLVLVVDEVPGPGGTAPARERREMLGGVPGRLRDELPACADVVDTTGGGDAFVAGLAFAPTRGDGPAAGRTSPRADQARYR